jgi:hypothetical protein
MLKIIKEFFQFLIIRKKLLLIPLMLILFLIGTLLFISQGTVFAPFIYAIF